MTLPSALSYVTTAISNALQSESTKVVFGRREHTKQTNQGFGTCNRVVVDPSVGDSAGKFAPPKYPGRNPAPIGSFVAAATVYVWAFDSSDPMDELLQYEAVTLLLGKVYRAIRNALHAKTVTSRALHGWYQVSDPVWVGDGKIERVRGAEWAFTLAVHEDLVALTDGEATNVSGESVTTLTGADGA